MGRIGKLRLTSLLANVVLVPAFIILLWLYLTKPCPECLPIERVVTKTVTIPVKDTTPKLASKKTPSPKKIIYALADKNKNPEKDLPEVKPTVTTEDCDSAGTVAPSACNDLAIYSETYEKDSCKVIVNDTVTGNRIAGRSVWIVNLKPDTKQIITITQREKVKLYVGVGFSVNQLHMERWGIGPSALLTIPKVGGIAYSFDAKNFSHQGTVYALIRIKR